MALQAFIFINFNFSIFILKYFYSFASEGSESRAIC